MSILKRGLGSFYSERHYLVFVHFAFLIPYFQKYGITNFLRAKLVCRQRGKRVKELDIFVFDYSHFVLSLFFKFFFVQKIFLFTLLSYWGLRSSHHIISCILEEDSPMLSIFMDLEGGNLCYRVQRKNPERVPGYPLGWPLATKGRQSDSALSLQAHG